MDANFRKHFARVTRETMKRLKQKDAERKGDKGTK
jgi:hypothetical protein